jgi:hypothetical protein
MGKRGAVDGRAWFTAMHTGDGIQPRELVDHQVVAMRPNQLWVPDCPFYHHRSRTPHPLARRRRHPRRRRGQANRNR